MRKTLLCISFLSGIIISAQAQIKKGSLFLGGDLSGYTQSTKQPGGTDKQNSLLISPVIGKAIKDNLIFGGNLIFSHSETDNYAGAGTHNNSTVYGAGVFLRKYRPIGTGGFYVFLQGSLNGSYYKSHTIAQPASSYNDLIKRTSIGIGAYPGISYAVSKRFHLESGFNSLLSINYFTEKRINTQLGNIVKYTTNGVNLTTSLNNATSGLYVGFRVLLGK